MLTWGQHEAPQHGGEGHQANIGITLPSRLGLSSESSNLGLNDFPLDATSTETPQILSTGLPAS
jgi:hypothetical protein